MKLYNNAEIYLTSCTHPQHDNLRYLGLDTKCDPSYLGSSTVLKWWIKYLGRSYFTKSVIATVTGSMSDCCATEQRYILRHDAINDPNYLNLNGGKLQTQIGERMLDLEAAFMPRSSAASSFISGVCEELSGTFSFYPNMMRQLSSKILCMLVYGSLVYDQSEFEYNEYLSYGSCDADTLDSVLNSLVLLGYLDLIGGMLVITEKLLDAIPPDVNQYGFRIDTQYNKE